MMMVDSMYERMAMGCMTVMHLICKSLPTYPFVAAEDTVVEEDSFNSRTIDIKV